MAKEFKAASRRVVTNSEYNGGYMSEKGSLIHNVFTKLSIRIILFQRAYFEIRIYRKNSIDLAVNSTLTTDCSRYKKHSEGKHQLASSFKLLVTEGYASCFLQACVLEAISNDSGIVYVNYYKFRLNFAKFCRAFITLMS